jgi:hypothetical protein
MQSLDSACMLSIFLYCNLYDGRAWANLSSSMM